MSETIRNWKELKKRGLNSKTLSHTSPMRRKTHFLIFWAIFKNSEVARNSHLYPTEHVLNLTEGFIEIKKNVNFHNCRGGGHCKITTFSHIFNCKNDYTFTNVRWLVCKSLRESFKKYLQKTYGIFHM